MTEQKQKKSEYQKAITAFDQAVRAFRKKDYTKTEELFNVFLDKFGNEKELVDRAQVFIKICESQKKKKTIQLKTFDDYYRHSMLEMNEGKYEESLKLLNKALEMKSEEGKIYYLLAEVHYLMEDTEECLEHLKKAIQIDKSFQIKAQNEPNFEGLWDDKKFMLITRLK